MKKKLTRKQRKEFHNKWMEFCKTNENNFTFMMYEINKQWRKIKFIWNKDKQLWEGKCKKSIWIVCFGYDGSLAGIRFI